MTGKSLKFGKVGERYATALFDLSNAAKSLPSTADDMQWLIQLLSDNADLRHVLSSPATSKKHKTAALLAILKKAGATKLMQDFCGVVGENNRLAALEAIATQFLEKVARAQNQITAQITTARALTNDQTKNLKENLDKQTGKDVALDITVDAGLIAGLTVNLGSTLYDASLKTKLDQLNLDLKRPAGANG